MFCFWHVRKVWKKNTVQKIKDKTLCVRVSNVVEDIMYSNESQQTRVSLEKRK